MLSQFDSECALDARSRRQPPLLAHVNRRACVLRKYEAALGADDFEAVIELELSVQRPRAPSIAEAPIFAPASARTWGPDQLLVPVPTLAAPPAAASPVP